MIVHFEQEIQMQTERDNLDTGSVSRALLEATRALLWITSRDDTRRVVANMVTSLGGEVVGANDAPSNALSIDLSFGDGPTLVATAPMGSTAWVLLEQHLPTFLDDARRALDGLALRPAVSTSDSPDRDGTRFVAFSQLFVPEDGIEQVQQAFRDRLGAVDRWPGFIGLEVWSDLADQGRLVMVSWWKSRDAFRAYMQSADHRESHSRIPGGDNRPRAREFRRFQVVAT